MHKKWSLKDLIDLEYFFYLDKDINDSQLEERDRKLYLERIEKTEKDFTSKHLILEWLILRRKFQNKDSAHNLPGDMFDQIYRLVILIFSILGTLGGFSLASAFLSYSGEAPVNVSIYMMFFVILQMIVFMATIFALFTRILLKPERIRGIIYPFLGNLIVETIHTIKKKFLTRISAEKRNGIEAGLCLIRGRKKIYGSIFFWPLFKVTQIFGIFFNIGVLSATGFKVTFSDLAFGWQTTLQVKSESISNLIEIIALPWSLIPALRDLTPSLYEIEGSRMILKEGIYHLKTADLVSWWPFLLLCVLFYAMIPRLGAWALGSFAQQRALKKLNFDTPYWERLIARMLYPRFSSSGLPQNSIEDIVHKLPDKIEEESEIPFSHSYIALIPEEIKDIFNKENLRLIVEKKLCANLSGIAFVEGDADEDMEMILKLLTPGKSSENNRLLIVLEAWQPPIKETIDYINEITSIKGVSNKVCIGLIGKPGLDTIFTKTSHENFRVWSSQIAKTGNPYIKIERLEDQVEI